MEQGQGPVQFEVPEWLEQVEGLLESLNEGVIITDDCHRMLFVNSCFEEMIGMPAVRTRGPGKLGVLLRRGIRASS